MWIQLLVPTLSLLVHDAFGHHLPFAENIMGGKVATIEEFPYQVAVVENGQLTCGGSIVALHFVLLAGHCVFNAFSPLTVHAGSAYWSRPGSVHHVDYNFTYTSSLVLNADLAILHVVEPFIYDATRQPLPFASSRDKFKGGEMATVTGWGTDPNSWIKDQLYSVTIPLIDLETCKQTFKGTSVRMIVPGVVCAGSDGKSSCVGDSGGPLVLNGRQVGIVSRGMGCEYPKYPGVYTDVGYYSDWITRQITT